MVVRIIQTFFSLQSTEGIQNFTRVFPKQLQPLYESYYLHGSGYRILLILFFLHAVNTVIGPNKLERNLSKLCFGCMSVFWLSGATTEIYSLIVPLSIWRLPIPQFSIRVIYFMFFLLSAFVFWRFLGILRKYISSLYMGYIYFATIIIIFILFLPIFSGEIFYFS